MPSNQSRSPSDFFIFAPFVMPAKKDDTTEEKKTATTKETAAKSTTAKKTTETKAAKSTTTKKATTTKEKKEATTKKTTPAKKEAAPAKEKKESLVLSKGKQRKRQIEDKFNGRRYYLGVGKRKTATALVRLHEKGAGKIFINNAELEKYFFGVLIEDALQPLAMTGKEKEFDITVKVTGGGVAAQAEAVRHGITRALCEYDASLRPTLKKAGLLTRDARMKERKKPGLKRARRAPQWRKR